MCSNWFHLQNGLGLFGLTCKWRRKRGLALPVLEMFSSMLHLSSFLTTDRIENGYDDHLC